MAIALVGNTPVLNVDSENAASSSVDTSGGGSLMIYGDAQFTFGGSPQNPGDNNGNNPYTALTTHDDGVLRSRLYYKAGATVGAATIFSVNSGGGGNTIFPAGDAAWFSGVKASSPFDAQNGATSSSALTLACGSVTPSEGDELLIAHLAFGDNSATASIDSGFAITNQQTGVPSSAAGTAMAYKIKGAGDTAAENPTWTLTGTAGGLPVRCEASIATFKAEPSSGAFIPIIGRGPGMALAGKSGLVG